MWSHNEWELVINLYAYLNKGAYSHCFNIPGYVMLTNKAFGDEQRRCDNSHLR